MQTVIEIYPSTLPFRKVFLVFALCLSVLYAAPGAAAETTPGERLENLLLKVQQEQRSVSTLKAQFKMLQVSELLEEPENSQGEFLFAAPDRVRWDYGEPRAMTVVIDGDEMTTWYRDLQRAERSEVGSYSDRVLKYMNASSSLESLLDSFDARVRFNDGTELPYEIELTPSYRRIARRVKSMVLWIDRDLYLPIKVRIETAQGEVTEFQFEDLVVNGELASDAFSLDLPKGVTVRSAGSVAGTG